MKSLFLYHTQWWSGEGGEEELRYQSRQYQELSTDVTGHQLIFKMSCEDQTVDHTKKVMGKDHDTIFV